MRRVIGWVAYVVGTLWFAGSVLLLSVPNAPSSARGYWTFGVVCGLLVMTAGIILLQLDRWARYEVALRDWESKRGQQPPGPAGQKEG